MSEFPASPQDRNKDPATIYSFEVRTKSITLTKGTTLDLITDTDIRTATRVRVINESSNSDTLFLINGDGLDPSSNNGRGNEIFPGGSFLSERPSYIPIKLFVAGTGTMNVTVEYGN